MWKKQLQQRRNEDIVSAAACETWPFCGHVLCVHELGVLLLPNLAVAIWWRSQIYISRTTKQPYTTNPGHTHTSTFIRFKRMYKMRRSNKNDFIYPRTRKCLGRCTYVLCYCCKKGVSSLVAFLVRSHCECDLWCLYNDDDIYLVCNSPRTTAQCVSGIVIVVYVLALLLCHCCTILPTLSSEVRYKLKLHCVPK